ncbi:helix-turn-helix domain-containing protein [Streptomyces sp. NBC_00878]|uniref:AraC-like ligand-binding domain-containing protein n=1 Tax=Streptomyces sp. NBC_00878 TaxID=2975854 RepID=UPI002254DE34|nr:helix-turn-helix domain-containing protein [Streptomyces sp. NBC_00878]MCX4903940.1 helix-turn-helix domain-containing protein [Streptomyces sp. NBC_00878]
MSSITTPSDENSAARLEFWRDTVSRNFVPLEIVPRQGPYFHAQLRIARVGAVQVSVITTPPHTARTRRRPGSDASDHVKVSLQLTGHCVLTQGDHQAELKPGELAVYDTRHPYTLDTDRPGRSLALMFPRAMLRMPDRDLARVTATSVSCRDGLGTVVRPFLHGLARQVDELESLGTPRLADNVVDLVGTLLAEHTGADRTPRHDDGRQVLTRRILAYMEQRLAEPELGPDQIAAAHHISRRYLYKLLAEHGYTVSGWIREHRLARCRRDLADPTLVQLPVGAIGSRWGFPGPAHFSHAFKTAYGISPSEARPAR